MGRLNLIFPRGHRIVGLLGASIADGKDAMGEAFGIDCRQCNFFSRVLRKIDENGVEKSAYMLFQVAKSKFNADDELLKKLEAEFESWRTQQ